MKNVSLKKPFEVVFNNTLKVLRDNEFNIKERSLQKKFIIAKNRSSFLSYGETIEITFKVNNDITSVYVSSYSQGPQILDWGVNDDNEKLIITKLKKLSI